MTLVWTEELLDHFLLALRLLFFLVFCCHELVVLGLILAHSLVLSLISFLTFFVRHLFFLSIFSIFRAWVNDVALRSVAIFLCFLPLPAHEEPEDLVDADLSTTSGSVVDRELLVSVALFIVVAIHLVSTTDVG